MITLNEDLMNKSWEIKLETNAKIYLRFIISSNKDVSDQEIKIRVLIALEHLKEQTRTSKWRL